MPENNPVYEDDANVEAAPQPPVGTHPAVITKVRPLRMDTAYGPQQALLEWSFTLTDKNGVDYDETALSGRAPTPRAKVTKWLAACGVMLKPGEGLSPSDLEDKAVLVVMAEDDNGYIKLMDMVAPPTSK